MSELSNLDWVIIAMYGAIVLTIGLWVGRGRQSEEDLFLGGRKIPAWAAFASMVATEISAATFIGVPAAGFTSQWAYLQFGFGSLCARIFLVYMLLRIYYELRVTTVYQFLGWRFGRRSQLHAAWLFLGGRIFASGVRLFIAALAFATVTGLSMEWSIVAAGVVAISYTLFGGIRAVIWTDTLQGTVFIVAAVATIVILGFEVEGGWRQILAKAAETDKTQIFHFPDWAREGTQVRDYVAAVFGRTDPLWVALLAGFFLTLASHGTDQDMVQRLLTTKGAPSSGRALIGSGLAALPVAAVFLAIGTGLWFFYTQAGSSFDYDVSDTDRIFPIFVLNEVPSGLRGLIFAGLFAAAMSSMDSALNSLATTWTVDIRGQTEGASASSIRSTTLAFGGLLVLAALACVQWRESAGGGGITLVGLALASMTVLYGGLLGAFLVGALTSRGDDRTVPLGIIASSVLGIALLLQPTYLDGRTVVAWPWWIIFGTCVSFAVGVSSPGRPAHEMDVLHVDQQ